MISSATICLMLLNVLLAVGKGMKVKPDDISYAIGSALAPIILTTLVVGIFAIFKNFKNSRSQTLVLLWTSAAILLASLENFLVQAH